MNKYQKLEKYLRCSALVHELKKSIVSNPMAEIDINTSEQSLDEMASKDNHWVDIIVMGCKDHDYGQPPCEVAMPDKRMLIISKVDEGLYSAFLKNDNPDSGEYGQVLTQFQKMTPEAMVQGMKAKGYLPRDVSGSQIDPKESKSAMNDSKYDELTEALKNFSGKELHIHIHKT